MLGAGDQPADHIAGHADEPADAAGARQRLDGICLCFADLDVDRFLCLVHGLALGGTVRVSQVQLVQPFFSMVFSVPLLGETLDLMTVGFALAVIATVFIGKKMPVKAAPAQAPYTPTVAIIKPSP